MKTYKIDPLGKNRPLMLVRGTRLPESFPDSVAEHMAKSLKANCRGVFTTINGEITSLTASPGVVISREANEDNNTLVVMTEGVPNESVDWEDSTGKQFRLEHAGQFAGSHDEGHDPYYTGAYKDLRTFVSGAVPYTGQPLVAANAKQWYSYTTPEGVVLTFRGCIQAPEKEGTDFVGLKIDSINSVESGTPQSFKLTLDCDSAVSLGLRNGMDDNSKPFDMITGIGWLQIVATDDFKSHIHEFNEAAGNGDATIDQYEAYDGFTYNVDLAAINTAGAWVIAGNNASFRIYVKSGSALEDSIIANASGYACECLGYDMSGSGDEFPFVEEVSPTLNAEPTVVNLTPDNWKPVVVIRFSSVQDGEKLHLDLSSDVETSGVIYFRSMNTAILGAEFIGSGEKNFVIDIPRGDDVFAFFGVHNTNAAGTLTISRTKEVVPSKTPGFYSADDKLIKAMTKEEVEQDYSYDNCPSSVTKEVRNATKFVWPDGVTKVGEKVFNGCTGLTSVTIPSTVTSIGDDAFEECTGLTSVTIPEGVTSIGISAFAGCSSLASIEIPSTVTEISISAFNGCTGLTSVTIPEGVTSIGRDAFNNCTNLTSVTIPSTVTSIGKGALGGCSSLASIEIPEGVTSISESAFSNCFSLTSVTIPEGVTSIGDNAFDGCSALTTVTIPSTVTSIGSFAFRGCTTLNPLTVPNTVTTIGDYAFYHVPKVIYGGTATGTPWGAAEVVAPPPPTPGFYSADNQLLMAMTKEDIEVSYGVAPSSGHPVIKTATKFVWPEGVTEVGNTVFAGCTGLTSVTIPEGVTAIKVEAFKDCTGLTSVTIPSTVTEIWHNAFDGCTALNPLTVPNTVTTIGSSAFKNVPKVIYSGSATGSPWGALEVVAPQPTPDPGPGPEPEPDPEPTRDPGFYSADGQLIKAITKEEVEQNYAYNACPSATTQTIKNATEFVWPEGVTSIGNNAFYECSKLTSVTIPEGVTSIGNSAFDSCSALTSVTIPSTVTSIGNGAFSKCSGLTSVSIPSTVTSIGNSTFGYCTGLTSVVIPEGVTSIGSSSFSGCSALTSVTIPNTVTSIGAFAFKKCSALNPLTVPNTVTTIGNDAFKNVQKVIYGGTATGSPWGAVEIAAS